MLGQVYDSARIGLVVPTYVTINSLEELNAHKERFGGEIVGIDAGTGLMRCSETALTDYGLDYKLLSLQRTSHDCPAEEGHRPAEVDCRDGLDTALEVRPL